MAGFSSPNYTQTPNDLFDSLMSDMGEAELKVTLAVIRGTFGYHRDGITLSLAKMAALTGLSENGVLAGAKAAEKRGTIERLIDGKKSTRWLAVTSPGEAVSTSPSEVALPHPVRQSTSLGEEQLGLKKDKETRKEIAGANSAPARAGGADNPELRHLSEVFVEASGIAWVEPKTAAEWKKCNKLWLSPLRKMIEQANGSGEAILRATIRKMQKDGLTIWCPESIYKVFVSLLGERNLSGGGRTAADPFASFNDMMKERENANHR